MIDKRRGKNFLLPWKEWVEFCAEHNVDPQKEREYQFDLSGGNSFTVACYEEAEGQQPGPVQGEDSAIDKVSGMVIHHWEDPDGWQEEE